MAGAERIIHQLLEGLQGQYTCHLGLLTSDPRPSGPMPWKGPVVGLRRILFGRYDLIHSHLFLPGLVVRLRRLWDKRFRWVHTVHYHDYESIRLGGLKRWLDHRWVFSAPDSLVAVSTSVLQTLPPFPRATLIENGIDLSPRASGGSGVRSHGGGGPVLGTVAMLRPEKGIEDLILAMEKLRETRPDARLRVAGDGPLFDELRGLVEELHLEDNIELAGYVDDMEAFYEGLDIYVQGSLREAFGLALLEAFRFELPIVASDTGSFPELLGGGDFGLLVRRDGRFVERLADQLGSVIDDIPTFRQKSREGLEHWQGRFSSEKMLTRYRELYAALLRPGVCMISPVITHSTGGIQRQLNLQSKELSRRGYAVYVLQRHDPTLDLDPAKASAWQHVEFLSTPDVLKGMDGPGQLPDRARGLAFVGFGILSLWRVRHRIAICHAHQLFSPTLIGVLARIFLGKGLVVKVTHSGALGELGELERLPFRRTRRYLFRFIDRLVALTPSMQAELAGGGFSEDRVALVPNCVPVRPDAGETRSSERSGPLRLLFCGRLSREKSLDTLIRAVGLVQESGKEIHLDLVGGPDPDRDASEALQAAAGEIRDPEGVSFHGVRRDVEAFYRRADVFVLPSESEGLSNSLLEALSFGLPCVASDIPQNRFVIEHGVNGLLFQQGSPTALSHQINALISDREEGGGEMAARLSAAALETVATRFTPEAIGRQLVELYRGVLAETQ
ncbi:glycosyltransferase family 4 protein [Gemmatimonadota bacterium]